MDTPSLAPVRPSARFMLSHPAHFVALGFGSGLSPVAPGTSGTLWAWAAFVALQPWMNDLRWAVLIALSPIMSIFSKPENARLTLRSPDAAFSFGGAHLSSAAWLRGSAGQPPH